ncbi:MAG: M6 family metalloprotease domain-containing protein [candidate division Zixibacteria bacterium]|nr:M6 family metalloprotease domain-containing protein [candidate division Zixibacteria bacterium]
MAYMKSTNKTAAGKDNLPALPSISRKTRQTNRGCPRISLMPVTTLLAIVIGLILVSGANAMPPYYGDGKFSKVGAGKFSESFYLNNKAALISQGLNAPGDVLTRHEQDGLAKTAVSGSLNILTVLVDFSDKISQAPAISFDTLMYVDISGSVVNYFKEVSYNNLIITTVVLPSSLGWTRAPQTYAYYVNGQNGFGSYPQNAQKLTEDIVDAVDPFVNFSQYDNDTDGYVDGLVIVHAGPGAEFTSSNNDIWSHKWGISPRLKDGVYISTYSMQPEYWSSVGDITCGVYCHELGHVFGLPDLYDTDNSSEGIGNWSLMAGGSWNGTLGNSPAHPDAWSKIQLGFVTPNNIATDQSGLSIPAVETNQTVFKLWTNGSPANEYFLIENRQQTGYDTYIPGNGLLIWHIDDNIGTNTSEWWPGSGGSHYLVGLAQADNLWQMEHNINRGNSGDSYPGSTVNRTFDVSSSPNSNDYAGAATNVSISSISNSASTMTADVAIGVPQFIEDQEFIIPNIAELHHNYPNPFNSKTAISFNLHQSARVEITVFDITGRLIKTLNTDKLEAGSHKVEWNGRDNYENDVSSGIYLCELKIDNIGLYRKMVLLK